MNVKTRKIVRLEEITDVEDFFLKKRDSFERNGTSEVVVETYSENGRLLRFRTVRREGEVIFELGYNINRISGRIDQSFTGVHHEKDTDYTGTSGKTYTIYSSRRYPELNDFLQKSGR